MFAGATIWPSLALTKTTNHVYIVENIRSIFDSVFVEIDNLADDEVPAKKQNICEYMKIRNKNIAERRALEKSLGKIPHGRENL